MSESAVGGVVVAGTEVDKPGRAVGIAAGVAEGVVVGAGVGYDDAVWIVFPCVIDGAGAVGEGDDRSDPVENGVAGGEGAGVVVDDGEQVATRVADAVLSATLFPTRVDEN